MSLDIQNDEKNRRFHADVDGLFSDFSDTAVRAREAWRQR